MRGLIVPAESGLSSFMELSAPAWLSWLSSLVAVGTPIALAIFRGGIADWITKGIQHDFDVKLETLRAALRTSEEQLKSDLREKEAEIGTLRNTVLSGSVGRQTLLDKRRFEAVEKIWTAINDMGQFKNLFAMTAHLNYGLIAKRTRDPRIQQSLNTIDNAAPELQSWKNIARDERPFVPELIWAYFYAYITLLTFNFLRFKTLNLGLEEPQKYVDTEHIKNILKAALPHQTQFIDEQDAGAYYYLLEEIENRLLAELRKILEGKEADQSSIQQVRDIMRATKEANDAQTKPIVAPPS
jgi:hypothetical protein